MRADAESLGELLAQLGYPTSADDIQTRLEHLLTAPDVGLLVAESGDDLVGLATFHIFGLIYRPRPQCRLTALVVHSRHRRGGIGAELVQAVERIARGRGCYRLELTTRPNRGEALAFYQALGFKPRPFRLVKALDDDERRDPLAAQHHSARPSVDQSDAPVLILTGPPGAGKTSVARALANTYQRAVHLESDQFFHFIRSGHIPAWKAESHEQNTMVMRLVADTAAGYARHGYLTVIDGIVSPRWFLKPMRTWLAAAGHSVAYAVLRAPLATCIARASGRSLRELADPAVVEQLWREFANLGSLERHAIEADGRGIEEVTHVLRDRLGSGLLTLGPATAEG